MPIHDWSKVIAGTFHDFHHCWIAELRGSLNRGLLPPGYYAQAEQVATQIVPDVLALQQPNAGPSFGSWDGRRDREDETGGLAVADAPPRVALQDTASEAMIYAARRSQIVIRHATGHRVIALIELVSPGNKEKRGAVGQFVDKAVAALDDGLHLQVIDLFPPGRFDPAGMHGAIWSRVGGGYEPPVGKPLTSAAYAAAATVTCYVEPLAVGDVLVDMPLFLTPNRYVNVPLEQTYMAAYEDVPGWWKKVLDAPA
jgi:hypothetical protein